MLTKIDLFEIGLTQLAAVGLPSLVRYLRQVASKLVVDHGAEMAIDAAQDAMEFVKSSLCWDLLDGLVAQSWVVDAAAKRIIPENMLNREDAIAFIEANFSRSIHQQKIGGF